MCGRFTQHYTWAQIHEFLSVIVAPQNLQPRYNIAPTTLVDMVRHDAEGRRELVRGVRWGHPTGGRNRLRTSLPRLTHGLRLCTRSRCFAVLTETAVASCRPRGFTNGRERRAISSRIFLSMRKAHQSSLWQTYGRDGATPTATRK